MIKTFFYLKKCLDVVRGLKMAGSVQKVKLEEISTGIDIFPKQNNLPTIL